MNTSQENKSNPIDIFYKETTSNLEIKAHFHNSYEIIYIIEGKAEFIINNRTYEVNANDMAFLSHLESHELKVTGYPYRRYYILIDPGYFQSKINEPVLTSIFKHRPDQFRHVISLESTEQQYIISAIKSMQQENDNKKALWEVALGSWLQSIFIFLYRNYRDSFPITALNNSVDIILQTQKYIEQHYTDEISLKHISNLFHIDMYYLSHLFKKVTGFNFKEYLIRQRLSKAKDLLYYSNDNITQVASNSGFNNVNHFIRIFKKFEGTTPYQYRKKYR